MGRDAPPLLNGVSCLNVSTSQRQKIKKIKNFKKSKKEPEQKMCDKDEDVIVTPENRPMNSNGWYVDFIS